MILITNIHEAHVFFLRLLADSGDTYCRSVWRAYYFLWMNNQSTSTDAVKV